MNIRKKLKYSPYYYICYLKISGKDSNYVYEEASKNAKTEDTTEEKESTKKSDDGVVDAEYTEK